jgi:hypothetical protein
VSNTTANIYPAGNLTVEKFREAMRIIDALPKPPMGIDLYGNPLINQAYELNWPSNAHAWIGAKTRRVIVVPKDDIDHWYRALLDAGAYVRLEPRIRDPIPETPPVSL